MSATAVTKPKAKGVTTRERPRTHSSTQIRAVLAHKSPSLAIVSRDTGVPSYIIARWCRGDLPSWYVAEEAARAKVARRAASRFINPADARAGR